MLHHDLLNYGQRFVPVLVSFPEFVIKTCGELGFPSLCEIHFSKPSALTSASLSLQKSLRFLMERDRCQSHLPECLTEMCASYSYDS